MNNTEEPRRDLIDQAAVTRIHDLEAQLQQAKAEADALRKLVEQRLDDDVQIVYYFSSEPHRLKWLESWAETAQATLAKAQSPASEES